MKIVILDASTLGSDIDLSMVERLGEVKIYQKTKPEEAADRISDCDVVILNKVRLDESNLCFAKKLKLICITATGFDNVSVKACKELGIALCNVSGYSTDSVAQTTLATVLALCMHIPYFDRYVKSGAYTESGVHNCLSPVFYELAGKTWGIAGYGNIGRKVAEAAKALGCRVIAYSRTPKEGVECVDLDALCRESDIITLHLPLSEETRGIIGKDRLAMMKKSVVLVNESRGAVTDETAVAKALKSGDIAAFGTDVYSLEPIAEDNPLAGLYDRENVIFTPHLAWGAYEARVRCLNEVILNIEDFLNGGKRNRIV